jgi:hypothetical protein
LLTGPKKHWQHWVLSIILTSYSFISLAVSTSATQGEGSTGVNASICV